MSAANALLQAIHQRLSGDAALTAVIGPDGIRDRLLPRAALPCIVIGDLETRDFSTSTEAGEEHLLVLQVWSDTEGRRQALTVTERLRELLHDAALVLAGFALVSLLVLNIRTRREPKTKLSVAEMRLRAVTE
jgi:hypothetical protein